MAIREREEKKKKEEQELALKEGERSPKQQNQKPKKVESPILTQISNLVTGALTDLKEGKGKGPAGYKMDDLLTTGREAELKRLGTVIVRKETIPLIVTVRAAETSERLRKSLDEAVKHGEPDSLSWG